MPLLSIVIPTYKRPKQLLDSIASLTDSNAIPEGVEVIIVNDDPQEDIDCLISRNFGKLTNMCVVNNSKNLGAPSSRNKGYNYTSGEWILFLDDDDKIDSVSLQEIIDKLSGETDGNLGMICSQILTRKRPPFQITPTTTNFLWRVRRHGQESNTSSLIFRRNIIETISGWDESLVAGQDTDLILRAAPYAVPFLISQAIVTVDQTNDDRITIDPRKQMIGKIQFLFKNYYRLHPIRTLRYALTIVVAYPYIRRFFR